MKTINLRSLLWLIVAAAFLFSCSTQETDQVQPTATKNKNARARIGSVLYEQVQAHELYNMHSQLYSESTRKTADDFIVPAGQTWNLCQVVLYGFTSATTPTFDVNIYTNDGGKPGELLSSSLNRSAEVVDEFDVSTNDYTLTVKAYQIAISDIKLTEGTYWLGISYHAETPSFFDWYTVSTYIGYGYNVSDNGEPWRNFQYSKSFVLLACEENSTIEGLITAFDGYISAGTISGAGNGGSAANRPTAFKNMLANAQVLLAANDLAGACTQLTDAQKRIHTGGQLKPNHFITGSSAEVLYDMITELKTDLGCQ